MFVPPGMAPGRPHLARPVRPDATGRTGPTPKQARGPHWRRTSHGFYVPAGTADDVEQRIAQCAPLVGPAEAVTGWAALRWRGAASFAGAKVPLVVAGRRAEQAGLRLSRERLRCDEIEVLDGLPVTSAVRSVLFEMRHARSWRRAVEVADLAAHAGLVDLADLVSALGELAGWTGVPQARRALAYADGDSGSVEETRMRLVWVDDARLPRPLVRRPVLDRDGRLIGTPALLDPGAGVVGEFLRGTDLGARARLAAYRSVGLVPVTMSEEDLASPWAFIRRLRAAHAHGSGRGPRPRRLDLPGGHRDRLAG